MFNPEFQGKVEIDGIPPDFNNTV